MPDKGGQYNILSTPNPQELSFRVWVDSTKLRPEDIPADLQTFRTTAEARRHQHLVQYYGDYVFTYPEAGDGGMWLYYAKNKTDAEKNTPFETYSSRRDYHWPSVLEDLYIVGTTEFPQTVGTGSGNVSSTTRYFPRFRYRPSVSYNSRVKIEQFLSPTKWPDSTFAKVQPVPTNIDAYFVGLSINFERCLHGDIEFTELVPGAQVVFNAGMKNPPASRRTDKQFFPATNFTDWAPFVLDDRQQMTNGVFLRERISIFPPPIPETILR